MNRAHQGFSFIDVVVGIALMLIVFLALFGLLRASLTLSALTKAKSAAIEIASTQMEYLHGLSYDALGTVGGIPAGTIPQVASSTVDGVKYTTRTLIEYYDDPADGLGASDSNNVTTDYKLGKVTVSYTLAGIAKSVAFDTNFVPPGIESSTGGGTLSLHIVNAAGGNVSNATVHIVNASTSPTIDFTTFSNTGGFSVIGGAATSSAYQIYVSRTGYSSTQTYPRTGQNVNPTPGYLTVVKNQVTSTTFAIDVLSTLLLSSFAPATTTTFSDTFANSSNLTSQSNVQVVAGALILASQQLSGSTLSTVITPNYLDGWGVLTATIATTSGTTLVVHVDGADGTPLPNGVLPGNVTGFSSFPVMLTGISTTTYPSLSLQADLTSNSTSTTPSLLDWSLTHTEGPAPLGNVSFTLTGAKSIGTDASSKAIYKTILQDATDNSGQKTESLEWDSYTLTSPNTIFESCPAVPYALSPGVATTSAIIVGTPTANRILIQILSSASSTIPNTNVILTKGSYAATVPASPCGFSYFGGLASGLYSATVSAPGHTTKVFNNINVSGNTATTTLVLP